MFPFTLRKIWPALLAWLLLGLSLPTARAQVGFSLTPAQTTAKVGDTLTFNLYLQNGVGMDAFETNITLNPQILQFDVSSGSPFKSLFAGFDLALGNRVAGTNGNTLKIAYGTFNPAINNAGKTTLMGQFKARVIAPIPAGGADITLGAINIDPRLGSTVVNSNATNILTSVQGAHILSTITGSGIVSVNFSSNDGGPATTPMAPTEIAGVTSAANWNNSATLAPGHNGHYNDTGAPVPLVDSAGAATSITLDWQGSGNGWASGVADTPGDFRMMKGYLDTGSNTTTTVTVAGLSPSASYLVYVYDAPAETGRVGGYTIGSQTYYISTASIFSGTYIQSTSTSATAPGVGNYAVFSVSGQSSFTLAATPDQAVNGTRAVINGIQIVTQLFPTAPVLTATKANPNIYLSWSPIPGAASYIVKRSTSPNGSFTNFASGVTNPYYIDISVTPGVIYYYSIVAVNSLGASPMSNVANAATAFPVIGNGTGLAGIYYNGDAVDYAPESSSPIHTATDATINFHTGLPGLNFNPTAFDAEVPGNHFTAVWTGQFVAPYAQCYYFQIISDDGARLSLKTGANLDIIIDSSAYQPATTKNSAPITLTAGQVCDIKLEYFQGTGDATIQLLYAADPPPDRAIFEVIPQTQLYPIYPLAPTAANLTALGGKQSVTLNWAGGLYAATYNIYRGTTAGGESLTPIATNVTGTTYTNSGLANGTTYFYYIVASNNVGSGPHSNEASAIPINPVIGNGDGLYGTYYGGAAVDYSPETGTPIGFGLVPTINFNAGSNVGVANNPGPFPSNLPGAFYTAVWTGQLLAQSTASYVFQINSDDGSRLTLGGDPIVDNSFFQGATAQNSVALNLVAGQKYAIKMEYFQGSGGATAQLLYAIQGGAFQIIPQTQLFSNLTTLPAAITSLAAVPYNKSVHLYWSGVYAATTYKVYRGTTPGGEDPNFIAAGIAGTAYTDNTAVNGVKYYYIVKGMNALGNGPNSNEASATPLNVVSAVAYWRFEEGTAGMTVTPGEQLPDSTGNHNTLQTPDAGAAPSYAASVFGSPTNPVAPNLLSANFTAFPGNGFAARELNTGGAGGDLNTRAFNQITIEASFNAAGTGGFQTFLGREGASTRRNDVRR